LLNVAKGDVRGMQAGFVDVALKNIDYQYGLINDADTVSGAQLGLVNVTASLTGFQLGLLNYTRKLAGLQIGLLNLAVDKESMWKVLPIVNANW